MKHFVKTRLSRMPPSRRMKSRVCVARVDAGQLQRDVRLDRRREVGRALEPVRPRAVVAPPGEQLVGEPAVGARGRAGRGRAARRGARRSSSRSTRARRPTSRPGAGARAGAPSPRRPRASSFVSSWTAVTLLPSRATAWPPQRRSGRLASIVAGQSEASQAPARITFGRGSASSTAAYVSRAERRTLPAARG